MIPHLSCEGYDDLTRTEDASSCSSFGLLFVARMVNSLKPLLYQQRCGNDSAFVLPGGGESLSSVFVSRLGSKGKSISLWSRYLAGRRLFLILCLVCFLVLQTTELPLGMVVPILTGLEFCPCTNLFICLSGFLLLMQGQGSQHKAIISLMLKNLIEREEAGSN